ncbi:IPT/TIG domain-containing protein [Bacteroides congonensis]|uniref:IPT/TIG domain-containing protein n=1 Tax=Bacteroides TaxID=816 RepID=UPI000A78B9B8|nr:MULTISPECIES: IPT/TIG domain-containing protein [Bacteroides]
MKLNIIQYITLTLLVCSTSLFSSCKDDDGHDAGSPVVVNRFYPTSGSAGTEILITGKNFSENPEDISVTLGNIPLKVLSCNMNNIMAIVPPKLGDGVLTVTVANREPVRTIEAFTYSFSAVVTTFAGSSNGEPGYQDGIGSEALFFFDGAKGDPAEDWRKGSICVDNDGNVYVGDCVNYCVRKITPDGTVTTLAGLAGNRGDVDGTGAQARFNGLYGMDCDAEGNIIMTDVFGWKIRKITPDGVVTTLGATDFEPWMLTVDKNNGDIFVSSNSGIYKWTKDGSTQIATGNFRGLVLDKEGNLYGADQILNGIVKFKAGTWEAETLTGKGTAGYLNGAFEDALFTYPCDLAIDSNGDIYVAGNGSWNGGENLDQSIRLLDMTNRTVRLVAGGTQEGYVDANGSSAVFAGPQDLAVDKNGVIYVYDKKNNVIRKIVYE